jgi:hypothetical protein
MRRFIGLYFDVFEQRSMPLMGRHFTPEIAPFLTAQTQHNVHTERTSNFGFTLYRFLLFSMQ